ncbi:hypothetical protein D512_15881 [Burkholderia pseudomallei MSHR1043]|nr:hypothetical protein D512_15881 [Burkholderia pseudomallei MSHR1043]
MRTAAPCETERIGNERRVPETERACGRADAVRGLRRLQRGARIGRARIERQLGHRRVGRLQEILIRLGVDGDDAELARRRAAHRVRFGARGVGLPQGFGRLRARDMPRDGQPVVVQQLDIGDILRRRAVQRVVAPEKRKRLADERGGRNAQSARLLAEQQIAAREKTLELDTAAHPQHTHARPRKTPKVIGKRPDQFGRAIGEPVERLVGRRAGCAQRAEKRLLVARAQVRERMRRQRIQCRGRHRAAGKRERTLRRIRAQVARGQCAQRAVMLEEQRRAGEFAQIVPLERRAEIPQRGLECNRLEFGRGKRRGMSQRNDKALRGEPPCLPQRRRGGGERFGRIGAPLEGLLRGAQRRLGRGHCAASRIGQRVENRNRRNVRGNGHERQHQKRSRAASGASTRCRRANAAGSLDAEPPTRDGQI